MHEFMAKKSVKKGASLKKKATVSKPVQKKASAKPAARTAKASAQPSAQSKSSKPTPAAIKAADKAGASVASVKSDLKQAKVVPAAASVYKPYVPPVFTNCREPNCELDPSIGGFCRMHYIANWKRIKRKELILKEDKLNQYIEELVNKYPEKYIEAIRLDLMQDKEFTKVVSDLELSDTVEEGEEAETIDSLLDNVRRDIDVGGSGGEPSDEGEDF